jgi:hypothetical protein
MDVFDELYPSNTQANNHEFDSTSNSDYSDSEFRSRALKRKKKLGFDDWCAVYSDDTWYLWNILNDYSDKSRFLKRLDYSTFCSMCYDVSD